MIKFDKINIKINNRNKQHYINKNYKLVNGIKTSNGIIYELNIDVKDLPENSHEKIDVICYVCKNEYNLMYYKYLQNIKQYNYYTCKKCSRIKAKETCLHLYGEDNYMKTDIGKQKYIDTCLTKYGVTNTLLDKTIQEKKNNTIKEKYGSNCALLHPDIKRKSVDTNLKLYGATSYNKSIYFKDKIHKKWIKFYNNKLPLDYNINDFTVLNESNLKIKCKHNHEYETTYKLLYQRTKLYNVEPCTICNPINNSISWVEQEIFNFISTLTVTEQTNKSILNGKHLDIYCPNIKFAIEYNGIFWHSEKYKNKEAHSYKSILCKNKNIKLYHIFENDWINDKNNIKELITNFINNSFKNITNYQINNNTIYINNDKIATIFIDDDTFKIKFYNYTYKPNNVFKILVNDLNLQTYYYKHDNNHFFINTDNLSFIKTLDVDYKYLNIKSKEIKLYNKQDIEKLNENIIMSDYYKVYDSGHTLYSFKNKHVLYHEEITTFLKINNIQYFIENNNYCFYNIDNIKYEICYIDSLKYNTNYIDKQYFYKLSVEAEQNNSFKFWIKDFEWDNINKRDILKSYILHAANKTKIKIYARDCKIQPIDSKTARQFEKENCFYGKRGASLNLGLVLKKDIGELKAGTLVMLYTFGYNFFSKNKNIIEIIRVGTLKYSYVIGGSSKLFNHFIKNYKTLNIGNKDIKIDEIKFYSDYDHNIGSSLKNINFNFKGYSKGGYMNYHILNNKILHRQPTKHHEIKDNENILCIPNAGVKIFTYKF